MNNLIEYSTKKLMTAIALTAHRRTNRNVLTHDESSWQQFLKNTQTTDEEILQSIDSDPDRFEQWVKQARRKNKKSLWSIDFSVPWNGWAVSASLLNIMAIFILMWIPEQDALQQSYTEVAQLISADHGNKELDTLPLIQAESFAFSAQNKGSGKLTAFLYGFNLGRTKLVQQTPSPKYGNVIDPEWQRFGEWYQLNSYLSQTTRLLDKKYWLRQHMILTELETKLGDIPSLSLLYDALEHLQLTQNARSKLNLKQQLATYWKALQVSYHD